MRTSISIGDYATTPYVVAGLDIPVYCVEELCYCIKENAFLLDASLMNESLTDWLGAKCGLRELAKELRLLMKKRGDLSVFASMILEYAGLYDLSVIKGVEQALQKGAGLSGIEKRKSQVDYLAEKKKYRAAISGYDGLLLKWGEFEREDRELPAVGVRAAILHNKGVAYAGLMHYDRAAECFWQAYAVDGKEEHYAAYLAAKRMELGERNYISFAARLEEGQASVRQLAADMERLKRDWEGSISCRRLKARKSMRLGGDKQKYYDENETLMRVLKDGYRECVSE